MATILIIGAHPDDCEVYAGGTTFLWRRRGDRVIYVSTTSGDAGHHTMDREALAARRRRECEAVAKAADVEYEILDAHDGLLEPTLERRLQIIRLIRKFTPDLVLTHRPNDYHPDHRYTSMLVQDAAYMVTVPLVCPDTPHLESNPVFGYLWDPFTRPAPFRSDVIVDVDEVMAEKWSLLHAHESQFYEWLPFNEGFEGEVPAGDHERRAWLEQRWGPEFEQVAETHRECLRRVYGPTRGSGVRFAEAFEIGEYGAKPTRQVLRRLFPLPAS